MRTNKRTVWFLTLISLVAVISIFYFNKDSPMQLDGTVIFGDNDNTKLTEKGKETDSKPVFAESYLFEELRMEVSNERSLLTEQLTTKITSPDFTSDEKNAAYDQMEELTKRNSAEALMEMLIRALGYDDAFVRTEAGSVKVTVLSQDGHSKAQADEIIHLVKSTWEDARKVNVKFEGDS